MPRTLSQPEQEVVHYPRTVEEMVALIEDTFREPMTNPGMSSDQIMYFAGQRSVVHWLRALQKRSQNKE